MAKKIDSLDYTDEELGQFAEKWIQYGSTGKPLDKDAMREAVANAWAVGDLPPPAYVEFVENPIQAKEVAEKYGVTLNFPIGAWDTYWIAFYDVFNEVLPEEVAPVLPFAELAKLGLVWGWEKLAICCPTPQLYTIETPNGAQLHREDGPAIEWPDGTGVYAIEDVVVGKRAVMDPGSYTPKEIDAIENADVREIVMRRYGVSRYLHETGAELVDAGISADGWSRTLYRDKFDDYWLVGVDGSTARAYSIPVDGEPKTCAEAHQSIMPPGFRDDLIASES